MAEKTLKPNQFGLCSLFALTLVVALLLWVWRLGIWREVIVTLAVSPAVLIAIILLVFALRGVLGKRRDVT